jgi:hypothetical protein
MFGRASRARVSVVRRTSVVLALALPASAWMTIAGAAPNASACSDSNSANHCYAEAVISTGTNEGIFAYLNVGCLYEPSNGNFATNEMWDTSSGDQYWVEVGVIGGDDYNGGYDTKKWFWANNRPNGGGASISTSPASAQR